jgi:hypothetical protein
MRLRNSEAPQLRARQGFEELRVRRVLAQVPQHGYQHL